MNRRKIPLVSIVVLTYNGSSVTLDCLSAIKHYTAFPFEVILVDNGSSIEEKKILQKELKLLGDLQLYVVQNKQNEGFATANNKAAHMAQGKFLVFLNNDIVVTLGWLSPLIGFLEKHKNVVACQPKIHSFKHKEYFDYAGGAGGFLDIFGYPFTRGRVFDHIERDFGQYDNVQEIFWATGACLVVSKKVFFEIGGFDEYLLRYCEEVDLCVRLKKKGYKIYCVPQSLVYHYGAYTNNKNLQNKIYLIHRNHMYLILKHYSLWPYLPLIVCRIFFDLASILYYIRELRLGFIFSVVKAYIKLIVDLPNFIKYGVISWSGRSLLENPTIYKGSIVVDYFLLGRKNFDEIIRKKDSRTRQYKRYNDITFAG